MAGAVDYLKSVRTSLEIAFTFNMVDLAHMMNSHGFLSDDDHSTVCEVKTLLIGKEKARIMVNSLIKKVEINSANYHKFLNLVKDTRKFESVTEVLLSNDGGSDQNQLQDFTCASEETLTSISEPFSLGPGPYQGAPSGAVEPDAPGIIGMMQRVPQISLGFVDDTQLDENDLTAVLNEVEGIESKWKVLGTKLGIRSGTKEAIGKDYDSSLECLDALLTAWLRLNYDYNTHGKPSWRRLASAIKSLNGSLFGKIVRKHRKKENGGEPVPNIGTKKPRMTVEQCPVLGRPIVMADVQVIKWEASPGNWRYLRLTEEVANKWKDIGGLLMISPSVLESYESQCLKKNESCMRCVFKKWMEIVLEEYPTSWYGLVKLLDDVGLPAFADQLEFLAEHHPESLTKRSS